MATDLKERKENQRKDRMLWEPLHTQFHGHKTGSGAFTIQMVACAHTCHPPHTHPKITENYFDEISLFSSLLHKG